MKASRNINSNRNRYYLSKIIPYVHKLKIVRYIHVKSFNIPKN